MLLQDKIKETYRSNGGRTRPEPTGDFSPYLPPDDQVRLELESLFPPFIDRTGAAAGRA
jgi:hypothetical protein